MKSIQFTSPNGKLLDIPLGLYINDEFVSAQRGNTIDIENPATGNHLATVAAAQQTDVDLAVRAAAVALDSWKKTLPSHRGQLLSRLADLIERDAEDLATLEALDAGIVFGESKKMHVTQSVETVRYFAGWADKISGQLLQIPRGIAYTKREPLGVCAAIVPWNAPLMITCWKLAPAIATGNTLVIKTPELSPLYGQKLALLIREAGFPPGVINIICGEGRIAGQALAEHMLVKKIAFTGSTLVGREIMKAAASSNLKKVTLELGGKGPSIVFDDADFDNAIFWTSLGISANNGQVCAAGSRIYVHEQIYDRFLKAFTEKHSQAVFGDPMASSTTKGPLISATQKCKVLEHIKRGKESGCRLLHGGEAEDGEGHFVQNTAFADVADDSSIMKEEIFGPVAALAKFQSEAEVIAKASDTEYGLAAAIFTNDLNRAIRVSDAIETGQVTVNTWGLLNANTPFGGVKQSGFGRDMGQEALEGWTTVKVVKINLLQTA